MSFPKISRYKPETASIFTPLNDHKSAPMLSALKNSALEKVKLMGLPTRRLERWKYTDIISLTKGLGAELALSDVRVSGADKYVHKLGDFLNDPPSWLLEILCHVPAREDTYHDMALWHLNNLYLRDGLVVDIPEGKLADKPVEITIDGHDQSFFAPRTVIRLGANSALTVIENHKGQGHYWNNRLTQIYLGPNAKLYHYRIQDNSDQAVYTQNTFVECAQNSSYEAFTLTKGAALSRNQIHVVMAGEKAECDLLGLNLIDGEKIADTTAEVEHIAPSCRSSQFQRSVLKDRARGIFQGKAYVSKDAPKTDAKQLSNALLLSEGAEMDTKPELEIYTDDVQCAHGATTGRLEDEPLFYLRSRGLSEQQARMLLIEAFIAEVVDGLSDKSFAKSVNEKARSWLN